MNESLFAVGGVFAVFSVSQKGMTEICHMRSYLMCAAGEQLNFK